ncbi:hypothetical protein AB5I41_11015 [Sphingomonas sp. MMS24-JH45]
MGCAKVVLMFGYAVSTALSVYMLQSYVRPALSISGAHRAAAVAGGIARHPDRDGRRRALVGPRSAKPFVIGSSLLFAISMVIPLSWPAVTALFIQSAIAGHRARIVPLSSTRR